jgi:hypothetical protein
MRQQRMAAVLTSCADSPALEHPRWKQEIEMTTYTQVHVVISLIGIGSGLVVLIGLLTGKRLDRWTALFLASTVATSVTGFGFPFVRLLPAHIVGLISLIALSVATVARYPRRLHGRWRATYIVCAVLSLYLNVFVGVVQAFMKIPALNALAPTQSEPPLLLTQLVVLALFIWLTIAAVRRFHIAPTNQFVRA